MPNYSQPHGWDGMCLHTRNCLVVSLAIWAGWETLAAREPCGWRVKRVSLRTGKGVTSSGKKRKGAQEFVNPFPGILSPINSTQGNWNETGDCFLLAKPACRRQSGPAIFTWQLSINTRCPLQPKLEQKKRASLFTTGDPAWQRLLELH